MPSGLIGFLSFFSFFFFFLCWKDSAGPIVCYWPNRLRPETLPWLSQKNQVPLVAACLESALSSCYSLPYPGLSHPGLQSNLVVTRLHPHCWASGKHRPKLSSLSGPGRQARRGLDGCWVSQCLVSINITVFETEIFDVANSVEKSPCYLCARMRRGYLYSNAQKSKMAPSFLLKSFQAFIFWLLSLSY